MTPQISVYKKIGLTKNPDVYELLDYLKKTKDGEWEDIVWKCRLIKDKEERDKFKQNMPTASLSGLFSQRLDSAIIEHSGVIAMDLDYVEDLQNIKQKLTEDPSVFCVFTSTSGFGLRVLFKIVPKKHRESFYGIANYILEKYQVASDPNGVSISKPYVVSFDADLYLNEDAPVWIKYPKENKPQKEVTFVHTPTDFEEVFTSIVNNRVDICSDDYLDWFKLCGALADQFGEEGRDYFHRLSQCGRKYNFDKCDRQYTACLKRRGTSGYKISTFYYLAKSAGVSIVSEKTKTIIRTTKNGKKAGLDIATIIKNLKEHSQIEDAKEIVEKIFNDPTIKDEKENEDSILEQLEMFITHNYSLRMNEVTGYLEQDSRKLSQNDLNSIFISAKKQMPKLDYQLMMRLLKSDFIHQYNPFYEFLGSDGVAYILPAIPIPNDHDKFKSPLIDRLSETIITENQAYAKLFTRKWIVSIISAMHKVHSPLFHCLLGPQGTGKTEWYRNLLPHKLQSYYAQSKLDKGKDDEILMTENILILDDEMYGKTNKESISFNSMSSQQWFSLRRPYSDHNEKILRLAVLCGNSNYLEVLKDPTGNRRVIPIEMTDIDKVLYNSIDKAELLKEAYMLYKQGFDWRITQDDKVYLNKDQIKFEVSNFERELLEKFFSLPSEDEMKECCKLSTSEIKIELEKFTRNNLNINVLGKELNRLNYIQKTVRDGKKTQKKWHVMRESRDLNTNNFGFTPENNGKDQYF